jgi:hypothetical protein
MLGQGGPNGDIAWGDDDDACSAHADGNQRDVQGTLNEVFFAGHIGQDAAQ